MSDFVESPIARLRALFHYDPNTGEFIRIVDRKPKFRIGDVAGSRHRKGYIYIIVDGRSLKAHRMAWAMTYGRWPTMMIDHINGIRDDNRIENLREVTAQQNARKDASPKPKATGHWLSISAERQASLSHERLISLLNYEPLTGEFTWKDRPVKSRRSGNIAGWINGKGYQAIRIDGVVFLAHRLAWFWTFKTWPVAYVDHINGDSTDNRIVNLRDTTQSNNAANRSNPRGKYLPGAYRLKESVAKPWQATITVHRKFIHLGVFATEEEAHAAYLAARVKYFGEFANRHEERPSTKSVPKDASAQLA